MYNCGCDNNGNCLVIRTVFFSIFDNDSNSNFEGNNTGDAKSINAGDYDFL